MTLTAVVTDPNLANDSNFSYAWQVLNPSGQVLATGTTDTLTFTPSDEGTYTAQVTLTDVDDGNRQYRDVFLVFAHSVTLVASVSSALAVADGSTDAGQRRVALIDWNGGSGQMTAAPTRLSVDAPPDAGSRIDWQGTFDGITVRATAMENRLETQRYTPQFPEFSTH